MEDLQTINPVNRTEIGELANNTQRFKVFLIYLSVTELTLERPGISNSNNLIFVSS